MILAAMFSAMVGKSTMAEAIIVTKPVINVIGNAGFGARFGNVVFDVGFDIDYDPVKGESTRDLWYTGRGFSRFSAKSDAQVNDFNVNGVHGVDKITMPDGIWQLKSGYPETGWSDVSANRKEVCGGGNNGYGNSYEGNIMRWSKSGVGLSARGVRKNFRHSAKFTLDNHIAGKAGLFEDMERRFYARTIPDSTHFYLWAEKSVRYFEVPEGCGSFCQATKYFALFGSPINSGSGYTRRLQFAMRLRDKKVYDISKRVKSGEIFVSVCGFWGPSELVYAVNIPNKKKSEFRRFRLPE